MAGLETQVGQIFINNRKLSKSFVSLFSEKVAETGAEIFILTEAGLQNSSAALEYEKILKSVVNTLRRNFKKPNQNAFENAIAQINEDLAGIASQGQTNWVGKLNACIAVRQADSLSVATTGKIHAYLFREGQLSDIADSTTAKQNPLRAFENFALGKIAKKDHLIFTTAQLFNYISIERLQKILADLPLSAACKTIADLIKELADESISFGTFIVELGNLKNSGLEEDEQAAAAVQPGLLQKFDAAKTLSGAISGISSGIKTAISSTKDFAAHTMLVGGNNGGAPARPQPKTKINIQTQPGSATTKDYSTIQKLKALKELPKAKKFFFIAALIFIVALAANIAIAARAHLKNKSTADLNQKLADIQSKINNANAAYIYNDQATTQSLLTAARNEFNTLPANNHAIADQANKISAELTALENSVEHVQTVNAAAVLNYNGSTGIDAVELVGNTLYLVNFQGDLFVPYALNLNQFGQNFTVSIPALSAIANYNGALLATDHSGGVYQINPNNAAATKQGGSVPTNNIGLAAYGAPAKIYTLDQNGANIYSTALDNGPSLYMSLPESKALGIAVDGSIYVLYADKILKFNAKQPKPFDTGLSFSNGSKIYTDKNLTYLYVLDPAKQRLAVLNKNNGSIVAQYSSPQFSNLKNFTVDPASKTAYLINGQSVLAVHF